MAEIGNFPKKVRGVGVKGHGTREALVAFEIGNLSKNRAGGGRDAKWRAIQTTICIGFFKLLI